MPAALHVLVANPDPVGAGHPDQQVGEGEAIVPDPEVLGPNVEDLRVDEGPRLLHLDVHHSHRRPDLWRGDRSAAAETGLPVAKGFAEVVQDDSNGSRSGTCDRLAAGAEDRIAKEADAVNSHGFDPTGPSAVRGAPNIRETVGLARRSPGVRGAYRIDVVTTTTY